MSKFYGGNAAAEPTARDSRVCGGAAVRIGGPVLLETRVASTLSQMSSTSGQATASRCETEFSVPVAAHGPISPAPGSALADASPNVLSGRDRGFYCDPPDEDDYAEGFSHKYGVLQC